MSDLRLLAAAPWIGALIVLVAPVRLARGLAVGSAIASAVLLAASLDAPPIDVPWLARGIGLRLAIDPLALVGLVSLAASAILASATERGRGRLAGILALHGLASLGLLAQDVVLLAAVWTATPALALALLVGAGAPEGRRAGRTLALGLSIAAAALLLAGVGAMVALHGASSGAWSAALAELGAVRVPEPLALGSAAALAIAATLALGLWPVHAGLVAAGGAGRGVAAPIRWLGLDALLRLWAPLMPLGAAASAPIVAIVAVCGALYAGLVAGVERDPERRAALLAVVPWCLAALGASTLALEGCVGALVLGVVGTLGADVVRAGPLARAGVGLGAVFGGGLVAIAALRFSDLTLGAVGPWAALGVLLALWRAGVALGAGDRLEGPGRSGQVPGAMERAAAGAAALLVAGLVARPAVLARAVAAGEAWVDAVALQRCLAIEAPRVVPVWIAATPSERCDAPLQGLRLGLARAREQAAREAMTGGAGR